MRDGELYHILPRPDGRNWDGVQYADPDSDNEIKGVAFLFKPSNQEEGVKTIYFKGLDPNVRYSLEFEDDPSQNCTAYGSTLMNDGLSVELVNRIDSEIIWIKA